MQVNMIIKYLPRRKPTALSGCVQRKQPHWSVVESSWSELPPDNAGYNWNTSKKPECLSSFNKTS